MHKPPLKLASTRSRLNAFIQISLLASITLVITSGLARAAQESTPLNRQGKGSCEAPAVTLTLDSDTFSVGEAINLSASASGGNGPYDYGWDVDNDGLIDALGDTSQVSYAEAYQGPVTVVVTDNTGCQATASHTINVHQPDIQLLAGSNTGLVQVCGNDDNIVDPGERWKAPVTFKNNGPVTATRAYAVFSDRKYPVKLTAHDFSENAMGICGYNFVDISGTGTSLSFIDPNPNDTVPANDDGATAAISLPEAFPFYGQSYDQVVMSSNGYLSLDTNETGDDYDNDCPLPQTPNRGGNLGRIMPMHDNLIVNGGAWYQHFAPCPRPAETGANLSCDVFQWDDVASVADTEASMKFQAILYPHTGQWVFQYATDGSNNASVALMSPTANDAISWACNDTSAISAGMAVCAFQKDNKPPELLKDKLYLETTALALGDLAAGAQISGDVVFSIDSDAECGQSFTIDHEASVFDEGFNPGSDSPVISATLGNNGVCSAVTSCSAQESSPFELPFFFYGMWWNPNRSGNGNVMHRIDGKLVYVQYTATPAHVPVWYITNLDELHNGQARNLLIHKSYPNGFVADTAEQINRVAGDALTTFISDTEAVQIRRINGRFSAEKLYRYGSSGAADLFYLTGMWWNPAESGWGVNIDNLLDILSAIGFTPFLYDDSGQPYWVQGVNTYSSTTGGLDNPVTITLRRFRVHCPHCPAIPVQSYDAGSIRMRFDSPTTGEIEEMNIAVDADGQQVHWQRSNLSQEMLTPYNPPD